MTDYDNTNRGALFKNDRKQKDTHPDYKGSLDVEGTEYWVSAWIKESRKGGKFMSLSLTPKEDEDNEPAPAPRQARSAPPPAPARRGGGGGFDDMDDDIPFAPMAAGRAFLAM